jgi:hypothetical protein
MEVSNKFSLEFLFLTIKWDAMPAVKCVEMKRTP